MTIRYNPNDGTGRWYEEYTTEERLYIIRENLLNIVYYINDSRREGINSDEILSSVYKEVDDVWMEIPDY